MSKIDSPKGTYNISKLNRPFVTVDILIFTIQDEELKTVLVKRKDLPFKEMWAIPGGFVKIDESLEEAATRELVEETGIKDVYLEQLFTFGDPKRDPRGRVITVSYFALILSKDLSLTASTDAKEVKLFSVNELPPLAFDHQKIIDYAVERLKNKIGYSNIVFGLLPKRFRLSDLQKVYEIILNKKLDKRNFRKKMLSLDLFKESGMEDRTGAHRPAMLYEFKKREVVFFD